AFGEQRILALGGLATGLGAQGLDLGGIQVVLRATDDGVGVPVGPVVDRPVGIDVVGGFVERTQLVERLQQVALATLVLADQRGDAVHRDPAGVDDVAVLVDLETGKAHRDRILTARFEPRYSPTTCRISSRARGRRRCSYKYTPCQVPSARTPSSTGT